MLSTINSKFTKLGDSEIEAESFSIEHQGINTGQKVLLLLGIVFLLVGIVAGIILFIDKYSLTSKSTEMSTVSPSWSTQDKPPQEECPRIVSRNEWRAMSPISIKNRTKPGHYVFAHQSCHRPKLQCHTKEECSSVVRTIQRYHIDIKNWDDIGYNFLIGGDGNVYEGRGWFSVGPHPSRNNNVGLHFCFMGNFKNAQLRVVSQRLFQQMMGCGIRKNVIETQYILRGRRDINYGSHTAPEIFKNPIQKRLHYKNKYIETV